MPYIPTIYDWKGVGKGIFASGSPLDPVNGHRPGQANNSYVFPGLCLGIVGARIQPVAEEDFIVAAEGSQRLVVDTGWAEYELI
nr:NADP dependent malic enzyme [Hymenolepis microstoma]